MGTTAERLEVIKKNLRRVESGQTFPPRQPKKARKKSNPKKKKKRVHREKRFSKNRWQEVRYEFLKTMKVRGLKRECACCGNRHCEMHVDHIKPKSKYPELMYDLNNLQLLCAECNLGKGNRDETDFRKCD